MVQIGEIKAIEKSINLDKKDRKILSLLMLNAKANLSELARQVELSKSNISRRISRLEREGLITGYHAFIDVSKIGLKSTIVLIKTQTLSTNKEEYIKKLILNKNIYALSENTGGYDLIIGFNYKDYNEKDKILDEILNKKIIKNFESSNITTYFPKLDYTKDIEAKNRQEKLDFDRKEVKIDKIDMQILSELSKNCRISLVDLAEKLKITREIATYRIKKLTAEKVIAKFQPTVNFFMLGSEFYFLMFKLSKPSKKKELMNYLAQTLRANTIIESEGSYQVMAFMQFKNHGEFRNFEEDIFKKFPDEIYDYLFEVAKAQYKLEWM
jgi:Lrp/AsnC family leucine-responsive transcriptional regulator